MNACQRQEVGEQLRESLAPRWASPGRRAIVVFVDEVDAKWLKFLSPGFRHCLAAVECESGWLLCNPKKDRIDLRRLDLPPGYDLAAAYAERGHDVLVGRVLEDLPRQVFALAPLTCVAVVKRLIGVRAAMVLTPYQLFRHLLEAHPVKFVQRSVEGQSSCSAASYGRNIPGYVAARA